MTLENDSITIKNYCYSVEHDGHTFILYTIEELDNNDERIKCFQIMHASDYTIQGYNLTDYYKTDQLQFIIDKDNLFYEPFLRFLKDTKTIEIQNDADYDVEVEKQGKKVIFELDDDSNVIITFSYTNFDPLWPFKVNIKDVMTDIRSKTYGNPIDIKTRIFELCEAMKEKHAEATKLIQFVKKI